MIYCRRNIINPIVVYDSLHRNNWETTFLFHFTEMLKILIVFKTEGASSLLLETKEAFGHFPLLQTY